MKTCTVTHNSAPRYLVGKTISSVVVQVITHERMGPQSEAYHVHLVTFTDGTSITFRVCELEAEYAVEIRHHTPEKSEPEVELPKGWGFTTDHFGRHRAVTTSYDPNGANTVEGRDHEYAAKPRHRLHPVWLAVCAKNDTSAKSTGDGEETS